MSTQDFNTFKEASALAKTCVFHFKVEVRIKVTGEVFVVSIPDNLQIADIESFTRSAYPLGMTPDKYLLSLMSYVDRFQVSSDSLAWRDSDTNLT